MIRLTFWSIYFSTRFIGVKMGPTAGMDELKGKYPALIGIRTPKLRVCSQSLY